MADADQAERAPLLGYVGEAITFVIVLVPSVGLAVRLIALTPYTGPTLSIAADASVPELAAAGAVPLLIGALYAVLVIPPFVISDARMDRHRTSLRRKLVLEQLELDGMSDDEATNRRGRRLRSGTTTLVGLVAASLAALGLLVAMTLYFPFPLSVLGLVGGLVAMLLIRRVRARARHPRPSAYWQPFLAILMSGLLSAALGPGFAQAQVTFAPGSVLPNGDYVVISSSGATAYLVPCGSKNVASVPSASIQAAEYVEARRGEAPSLLDRLKGEGWEIIDPGC